MEKLLLSTSTVGCSVSILFSLSTVVVLSCYRKKTRPLKMKQQFSISLLITNVTVLAGFQGLSSEYTCRFVTMLLHYAVIVSFAWIFFDSYFTLACIKQKSITESFLKLSIAIWIFPIPFLLLAIIIGFTVNSNFGSKVYTCWKTDHVIWTLVIPCSALIFLSLYMIIMAAYIAYMRQEKFTSKDSENGKKLVEATKYGIKTNFIMLLISTVIWIFGCQTFWSPKTVNFQLIFGLGTGIQGLFLFFFYCVFCLELDLYVADQMFFEKGLHCDDLNRVEAVDTTELPNNGNAKQVSRNESMKRGNSHKSHEKTSVPPVHDKIVNDLQLESSKQNTLDESNLDEKAKNTNMTIQIQTNSNRENEKVNNLKVAEAIQVIEETPSEVTRSDISLLNTETQPSDENNERKISNESRKLTPNESAASSSSEMNVSKLSDTTENRSTSSTSMTSVMSTFGFTSHNRRTSRTSNVSYGLNELETLFNNPDIMNQALPRRGRQASAEKLAAARRKHKKLSSEKLSPVVKERKITSSAPSCSPKVESPYTKSRRVSKTQTKTHEEIQNEEEIERKDNQVANESVNTDKTDNNTISTEVRDNKSNTDRSNKDATDPDTGNDDSLKSVPEDSSSERIQRTTEELEQTL